LLTDEEHCSEIDEPRLREISKYVLMEARREVRERVKKSEKHR